ncbi:MAG TPA: alpha/beta hydrolase fold domain-containing protein [Terriglobia bacterium]|nr:alpha/beta hydrolase fold domain-containing protein [Terriglobia bacterium]
MLHLAILAVALTASSPGCSKALGGDPAGNYIVPGVIGNVVYRDGLTLDAYAPEGQPRPAAVIIHGSYGNKRTHVTQLFEPLARAGYAWFSIDYQTLDDVGAAIRFIRCPGRFNITREMVLIGEDTGAEIVLKLAARGGFRTATFGAKLSPAFIESTSSGGETASRLLPGAAVVMFHGAADDESPPAPVEALCKRMPNCTFHAVPGAIHEFENWHPDQWSWKEDFVAWLRGDRRGLWKDIAYARPGGRDLLMDADIPEGAGPFPAVIVVHGGGWEAGNKVTYVSPVFEPLARARMAWFSIDYRLTPYVRVPDQLDDVRAAIRYVRTHAARFHIDPNRIALLGESASGHLVAEVASASCRGCDVQAVVAFYGVYNFTGWPQGPDWQRGMLTRLFGDWTPETLARYSPLEHVTSSLPPILLIQGTNDELYQGTLEYADRLKQAKARYNLVLLKDAPHGMENWEGHPEWAFYKQKLVDWLSSVFARR